MNFGSQTFLRRTAAAITAAASILIADTAAAQTVTLSSGTSSCTYTGSFSMAVQPNGNFVVNCAASAPPTPGEAGTFSLSSSTLTIQAGTSGQLTVSRTVGTTDAVNVPYTIAGAGCTGATGTASFANASAASQTISIAAITANSSCTVTLSAPTISGTPTGNAPVLGTALANITVSAAAPPAPPGSCPTPPATMKTGDLGLQGATQRPQMISGQVISFPLPTAFPAGSMLGVVRAGETTATPAGSFFEMTVSKCPGEIKTVATAGTCYVGTYTQNLIEFYWFFRLNGITANDATAMGGCVALETAGPWYLNARWTYPVPPPWGYGSYVFQWQAGGM